ncbi:MAG: phenylalanine--tRNA ligase subunit beta [Epsilonproteobacteria bacterium]|nr:phenylalanine--tRNA ligase subunit beta [Campylobacterota bacterium]
MIVTREWLQEWIDLEGITTQEIIDTLNRIGLEVAEYKKIEIPQGVVVGRVKSCQKHPDAKKLHICEVDVGDEILKIVCGASNVQYARYVAVAKIGSKLKDLQIEKVEIRGVESSGMVCSSSELGLPKMENGIMLLDDSIGKLVVGKELREYDAFRDEVIDIEITPNRGDCLSVKGVARELGVALKRRVKFPQLDRDNSFRIGIGRILNILPDKSVNAQLLYKAFRSEEFSNPFLIRMRIALVGERFENRGEEFAFYITHSTGVITRIYGYDTFRGEESPLIIAKKDEEGYDCVYGDKKASVVGVYQFDHSKPKIDEAIFVLEASYVDPEEISQKMFKKPIENDWSYYRSGRGSDPRLEVGINYAKLILDKYYKGIELYSGMLEYRKEIPTKVIKIDFEEFNSLIGQELERSSIVEILKALGFTIVNVNEDSMVVQTPIFRHDISNLQDVAEEIVRIYGIDNLNSKPLKFVEKNRINEVYKLYTFKKELRERAIANGYFETLSFIFNDKSFLEKYGFETLKEELDLINPITSNLNTLRTSLIPNLISQTIQNLKNAKKQVKLFEIGSVFDTHRQEKEKIGFIFSGASEPEEVKNQGKPANVTLETFISDLSRIVGDFELKKAYSFNKLMHPYQSAIALNEKGEEIGVIYKIRPDVELELVDTFVAEFDLEKLQRPYPKAKEFSPFQLSFKDLSLLIPSDMEYKTIKDTLKDKLPQEVKRFYPIDLYEDEQLGDKKSLTLRFAIQSDKKTLTEEEISALIEEILALLKNGLGIELR